MKRLYVAMMAAAAALTGCAATDPAEDAAPEGLPVDVVHSSAHCGLDDPVVRTLDRSRALTERLRQSDPDLGAALGEVDGRNETALVVAMGRRPTAGYSVDVDALRAVVDNGTVRVAVRRRVPGPGAVVANVLTSPCLVLRIPQGDYDTVEVVDRDGSVVGVAPAW